MGIPALPDLPGEAPLDEAREPDDRFHRRHRPRRNAALALKGSTISAALRFRLMTTFDADSRRC